MINLSIAKKTKIELEKKLRRSNLKIYIIFKVRGPKYIFLETFNMTLIFCALFILVPLLSTSPLTKKSEIINLQLGLNCIK